jgi:hypothetical protein
MPRRILVQQDQGPLLDVQVHAGGGVQQRQVDVQDELLGTAGRVWLVR